MIQTSAPQLSRRGLLGCFIAAPAIVRAGSIMRVRGLGAEVIRAQGPQELYNEFMSQATRWIMITREMTIAELIETFPSPELK